MITLTWVVGRVFGESGFQPAELHLGCPWEIIFEHLVSNRPWEFNLIAATLYSSVSSSSLKLILVSVLACDKYQDQDGFQSRSQIKARESEPEFLWCLPLVSRSQYPHCLSEFSPAVYWTVNKALPTLFRVMCKYRPPRRHVLRWHEIFHPTSLHPFSEASTDKPRSLLNQRHQ